MTSTDLAWTDDDDASLHLAVAATEGRANPLNVAAWFFHALLLEPLDRHELAILVTPESRESWGDFSEAAQGLQSIRAPGLHARALYDPNAEDVAYVGIVQDVAVSRVVEDAPLALVITLVRRSELGGWLVHAMGGAIGPVEVLPRSDWEALED